MTLKKHIPNIITCLNLAAGMIGIYHVLEGRLIWAAYFVLAAALFDFLDGFVARLLNAYSEIGKELDSLADVVTFGVLPSFVVFKMLQSMGTNEYLCYIAFLIGIQSALRLAKFNIDTRQTDRFIGLPTPANALFLSTLPHLAVSQPYFEALIYHPAFLIVITLVFSFLLTAELPLLALKFKSFGFSENLLRYLVLIISLLVFVILGLGGIPFAILAYILLSIVDNSKSHNESKA